MRVVDWHAEGLGVGNIVLEDFARRVRSTGFHDLIGNSYVNTGRRDRDGKLICRIAPLPLHRGYFLDQRVRRIETVQAFQLPYHRRR